MQNITIIAAPGFEEIELLAPLDILRRMGVDVTLAGLSDTTVIGAHEGSITADTTLDQVDMSTMDALILPGGAGSWVMKDSPAVIECVQQMFMDGKLVAAICAAPIVLAEAGIITGKNITAYPAGPVYEDLHAAVLHKDEDVVIDGNIITGRGPGVALAFGFAVAEYLGDTLAVEKLKEQMCYRG